jgi:hypothetical protein
MIEVSFRRGVTKIYLQNIEKLAEILRHTSPCCREAANHQFELCRAYRESKEAITTKEFAQRKSQAT